MQAKYQSHGGPALSAGTGRKQFWRALAYYLAKDNDTEAVKGWNRIIHQYNSQLHPLIEKHIRYQILNLSKNERSQLWLLGKFDLDVNKLPLETRQRLNPHHPETLTSEERRQLPKGRPAVSGKSLAGRDAQHRSRRALIEAGILKEPTGGTNGLLNFVVGDTATNQWTQQPNETSLLRGFQSAHERGLGDRESISEGIEAARRKRPRKGKQPDGSLIGIDRLEQTERRLEIEPPEEPTSVAKQTAAQEKYTVQRGTKDPLGKAMDSNTQRGSASRVHTSADIIQKLLNKSKKMVGSAIRIGKNLLKFIDFINPFIELLEGIKIAQDLADMGEGRLPGNLEEIFKSQKSEYESFEAVSQKLRKLTFKIATQIPDDSGEAVLLGKTLEKELRIFHKEFWNGYLQATEKKQSLEQNLRLVNKKISLIRMIKQDPEAKKIIATLEMSTAPLAQLLVKDLEYGLIRNRLLELKYIIERALNNFQYANINLMMAMEDMNIDLTNVGRVGPSTVTNSNQQEGPTGPLAPL